MLLTIGVGLLVLWTIGVAGPFDAGQLVHLLLLIGLMLLLIAFVKARDVALARTRTMHTSADARDRESRR
jgi:hypothetical protein